VPPEVTAAAVVPDAALTEAVASFQAKVRQRPRPPALDDPCIAGLTSQEYFALPDGAAEALWDTLAAEALAVEALAVIEARPDARLPGLAC
jgi:hypothetical protein